MAEHKAQPGRTAPSPEGSPVGPSSRAGRIVADTGRTPCPAVPHTRPQRHRHDEAAQLAAPPGRPDHPHHRPQERTPLSLHCPECHRRSPEITAAGRLMPAVSSGARPSSAPAADARPARPPVTGRSAVQRSQPQSGEGGFQDPAPIKTATPADSPLPPIARRCPGHGRIGERTEPHQAREVDDGA